jgi:hypothetical protein
MTVTLEWLRAEAVRLGLTLTDEDLEAIRRQLETTREGLAKLRHLDIDALEPGFIPPAARVTRRDGRPTSGGGSGA